MYEVVHLRGGGLEGVRQISVADTNISAIRCGLTSLPESTMLRVCHETPQQALLVGRSTAPLSRRSAAESPMGHLSRWGRNAMDAKHCGPRLNARCTGFGVLDDPRLPKSNAANLTSVTESAVLCSRRAWVPTRAPAASTPGGSGWIPVSRKGEATGPAVFLLVHFSSKIGAA